MSVFVAFLLAAPASAASNQDGRPDFSGVWENYGGFGQGPPTWPENPPYTEKGREAVQAYQNLVEGTGATPGGFCVGYGMPGALLRSGGYPMEIIQRPEQITIIYEAHTEVRRIYLKGPNTDVPDKDLFPTRLGYSTGEWQGDTLVVKTTHLKEQADQREAHSSKAQIVERYNLTKDEDGQRVLEAQVTLFDPVYYTEPVTVTKRWAEDPDGRMLHYNCNEPAWEEHLEKLRQKQEETAESGESKAQQAEATGQ